MVTRRSRGPLLSSRSQTSKRRQRAAVRQFFPNRTVTLVSGDEIVTLQPSEISPERVGSKAYGLSCLPSEWVPPFFVVESATASSAQKYLGLIERIRECIARLRFEGSDVFIRSSGTKETIEQRGELISQLCAINDVPETIRQLSEKLADRRIENVHWIVQQYVRAVRKGLLSNERRLTHEPRDFVAEFELQGESPGYTVPVAVRHWREGGELTNFDLSCSSRTGVTLRLKRVALWAAGLPSRALFEWVWNGSRVWIVQADLARPAQGVNPLKLRPQKIPLISAACLKGFRIAGPTEFERYRKLRNAQIYSELGYRMPVFYILDDAMVIQRVIRGESCDGLHHDLQELTRRPLIIRTDGTGIHGDQREMLPRSEHLRTAEEAKGWLMERFSSEIRRMGIGDLPLCLIAHHFIPSTAAAWARAEIDNNVVRVESLWGVPEGLYWHTHDTFEVDAENVYPIRQRLRFKGTFIAPDEDGRWVHFRASAPFDWGRSVRRKEWLFEIARTTKKVAERERHPVTLMWFIDNDPRATPHRVLPWYHTESEIGTPKAAPRRKLTMASDFKIETQVHWQELKSLLQAGKRIERVMLEPKDPELVRNQEFARELAEFASANKIVIELAGGILSHGYHILQRYGAHVECIDLFGAEEDEIEYNKLVRDKVPDLIERKGEGAEVLHLKGEALLSALSQKLVEESYEAIDARAGDELIGELADIQEVIEGICESLQIPHGQLLAEKEQKRKRRGGFLDGLMLRKTSTPHTLATRTTAMPPSLRAGGSPHIVPIEEPAEVPASAPYSRPDVRNIADQPEALLTFETELSKLGNAEQSRVFEIPIGDNETRSFRLSVNLERDHSSLWGQVRLKLEPSQMSLKLNDSQMALAFPETDSKHP